MGKVYIIITKGPYAFFEGSGLVINKTAYADKEKAEAAKQEARQKAVALDVKSSLNSLKDCDETQAFVTELYTD